MEPLGFLDVQGAGLLRAAALFLPPVHLPLLRLQRGVVGFVGEEGGGRERESAVSDRDACVSERERERARGRARQRGRARERERGRARASDRAK